MTMHKKSPSPSLTLIGGHKADYKIRLVHQILRGTLSGNEFVNKVRSRGQLTMIDRQPAAEKHKDK